MNIDQCRGGMNQVAKAKGKTMRLPVGNATRQQLHQIVMTTFAKAKQRGGAAAAAAAAAAASAPPPPPKSSLRSGTRAPARIRFAEGSKRSEGSATIYFNFAELVLDFLDGKVINERDFRDYHSPIFTKFSVMTGIDELPVPPRPIQEALLEASHVPDRGSFYLASWELAVIGDHASQYPMVTDAVLRGQLADLVRRGAMDQSELSIDATGAPVFYHPKRTKEAFISYIMSLDIHPVDRRVPFSNILMRYANGDVNVFYFLILLAEDLLYRLFAALYDDLFAEPEEDESAAASVPPPPPLARSLSDQMPDVSDEAAMRRWNAMAHAHELASKDVPSRVGGLTSVPMLGIGGRADGRTLSAAHLLLIYSLVQFLRRDFTSADPVRFE